MVDPWLGFLNEAFSEDPAPDAEVTRVRRRQEVLDRAACSFPFPLEITVRATVVDHCEIDGQPHLVLAPTGLCEDALETLGGLVIPSERKLFAGSIVEATCALADPDDYWLDEGMLALSAALDAIVPIEP